MEKKKKLIFDEITKAIKTMSKDDINKELTILGCTWNYDKIKSELEKTYNDVLIGDRIFDECTIDDSASRFTEDFVDEAVWQVVIREQFPFTHYGIISQELDEYMESGEDEKVQIEKMETLFRKLFKMAKVFQLSSLEGITYQVNDGVDMMGILTYFLDLMMCEGRKDKVYNKRLITFVDKFLAVFTKTSDIVKVTLQYEQAQAYIAMNSKKGEQMFLTLLKTYQDPTDVVLHYALAYIDDYEEKTKRILQKYAPILNKKSDAYDTIQEVLNDLNNENK